MKTGIELIAEERQRQVTEEGWTADHDDAHTGGELAMAGAAYAVAPLTEAKMLWPWGPAEFNPKLDDVRNLVRAGALIAAEIDRRQRAAELKKVNAAAEEEQP